jgi:hypothetical protein
MSLIEELGAVLYANSARMPLAEVAAALERLRAASALLMWIRQESSRPIGVPELAGATEHLEQAGRAIQVAQDSLAEYLAAIGLGLESDTPPEEAWRRALDESGDRTPGDEPDATGPDDAPAPGRLGRWWAERVTVLTDGSIDDPDDGPAGAGRGSGPGRSANPGGGTSGGGRSGDGTSGGDRSGGGRSGGGRPGGGRPGSGSAGGGTSGGGRAGAGGAGTGGDAAGGGVGEPPELLRRIARHARSGNREALRRELATVSAPVGLGLAAISPPVLHRLAGDLLGHQPRAADLAALTNTTREPVRALLPKLPAGVVDTLLARVCRIPPPRESGPPAHPADSAVTSAVLVGVLLSRLGRDPDSLRADAPAPQPRPAQRGAEPGR